MMITAFIVMNTLTIYGLVVPNKVDKPAVESSASIQPTVLPPTVTLTAAPSSISVGDDSGLKWATTGDPKCVASSSIPGPWSGEKTPYGAESSGVIKTEGNFTYTIKCTNAGGTAQSVATITVGKATAPKQSTVSTSTASTPSGSATVYCKGRTPCYGPKEVATHGSAGNCWGWNVDKVFNISKFDAVYHQAKSGISSIEVNGVCGKDLGPSLGGSVPAGGQTRNHLQSTKSNASANTNPYFVGYFDSTK